MSVSVAARLVEPARGLLGHYSKDDSDDNDSDDDDDDDCLLHRRSSVGGYKSNDVDATHEQTSNYNGENNDDYFSDLGDTMSLTDAAVSKFSFVVCLTH